MPSRIDPTSPSPKPSYNTNNSNKLQQETPPQETGFFARVLRNRSSMAQISNSMRTAEGQQEVIAKTVVVSQPSKPPSTSMLRKKASFRERFWSKSSANYFNSNDENHNRTPSTLTTTTTADADAEVSILGKRAAYVPRHAASDFVRNARRSHLRGARLVALEEDENTIAEEKSDSNGSVTGDAGQPGAAVARRMSGATRRNSIRRHSREVGSQMQLSPMHLQPCRTSISTEATTGTSATPSSADPPKRHKQTASDDYTTFLAQAESYDRALRTKVWREIERYASSSGTPHSQLASLPQTQRNVDQLASDTPISPTSHSFYPQIAHGGQPARTLKRQPSVLGQRIAEYIKPARGCDERRGRGLVTLNETS